MTMLWQLLLLQAAFFFLLIFTLQRLFHGHLLAGIRRIEKLQQQNQKKEEELRNAQEAVIRLSEKRLKDLDTELAARRSTAEEETKALKQSARAVMEEEKELWAVQTREKEKHLIERLERESASHASELALRIVTGVFSPKVLEKLHEEVSNELLDSLMQVEDKRAHLNGNAVRVRSAFALSAEQKETLKGRLFPFLEAKDRVKSAAAIPLTEEIDPSLIAGFIIFLGEKVLDGSLLNKFEQQAKKL